MAEAPCAVFRFLDLTGLLSHVRLGDIHKADDYERENEDSHSDEQQCRYIGHSCRGCDCADKHTYHKRGDCSGQGVKSTTGLHKLIALVAATTEQVEHGVDNSVEHTYAESADKRTQQVYHEVESDNIRTYCEYGCSGADLTREPLEEQTHKTYSHCDQGCLLVADLAQHSSCGNTHEEICKEVHHVAEHARP